MPSREIAHAARRRGRGGGARQGEGRGRRQGYLAQKGWITSDSMRPWSTRPCGPRHSRVCTVPRSRENRRACGGGAEAAHVIRHAVDWRDLAGLGRRGAEGRQWAEGRRQRAEGSQRPGGRIAQRRPLAPSSCALSRSCSPVSTSSTDCCLASRSSGEQLQGRQQRHASCACNTAEELRRFSAKATWPQSREALCFPFTRRTLLDTCDA